MLPIFWSLDHFFAPRTLYTFRLGGKTMLSGIYWFLLLSRPLWMPHGRIVSRLLRVVCLRRVAQTDDATNNIVVGVEAQDPIFSAPPLPQEQHAPSYHPTTLVSQVYVVGCELACPRCFCSKTRRCVYYRNGIYVALFYIDDHYSSVI